MLVLNCIDGSPVSIIGHRWFLKTEESKYLSIEIKKGELSVVPISLLKAVQRTELFFDFFPYNCYSVNMQGDLHYSIQKMSNSHRAALLIEKSNKKLVCTKEFSSTDLVFTSNALNLIDLSQYHPLTDDNPFILCSKNFNGILLINMEKKLLCWFVPHERHRNAILIPIPFKDRLYIFIVKFPNSFIMSWNEDGSFVTHKKSAPTSVEITLIRYMYASNELVLTSQAFKVLYPFENKNNKLAYNGPPSCYLIATYQGLPCLCVRIVWDFSLWPMIIGSGYGTGILFNIEERKCYSDHTFYMNNRDLLTFQESINSIKDGFGCRIVCSESVEIESLVSVLEEEGEYV